MDGVIGAMVLAYPASFIFVYMTISDDTDYGAIFKSSIVVWILSCMVLIGYWLMTKGI